MWAYRISGRRVYSLASKDWSEEERGLLDNPRPTTDSFLKELHEGEMQMSHLHLQSYEKKHVMATKQCINYSKALLYATVPLVLCITDL